MVDPLPLYTLPWKIFYFTCTKFLDLQPNNQHCGTYFTKEALIVFIVPRYSYTYFNCDYDHLQLSILNDFNSFISGPIVKFYTILELEWPIFLFYVVTFNCYLMHAKIIHWKMGNITFKHDSFSFQNAMKKIGSEMNELTINWHFRVTKILAAE